MTLHLKGLDIEAEVGSPRSAAAASPAGLYGRGGKRFIDLLVVLLSAPVILPLIVLLAILVACDGHNPFYSQQRVGRGGRQFRMWKLRSMVYDADRRLESYLEGNPDARREWDTTQKLKSDPRITSIGRILRKSSLDELPQFWNVLSGDMSLVGPRPMMVNQQVLYPGHAYYALRPGITGPWQVSERNGTSFAHRAHFDAGYLAELSLPKDLTILGRTALVVLRGTGW